MTIFRSVLLASFVAAAPAPVMAGAVVSGFNSATQEKCDDCASVGQPFAGGSLNFFGTSYANAFVSSNGYVTFGANQTSYTPQGLGQAYRGTPIIAAFYSDVETTTAGGGTVTYGNGSFAGRDTFGATWNAVGRFDNREDLLNTFQILLVNRADTGAGNFDIYLNYDNIAWDRSESAGAPSVGYSAGTGVDGTYYQLPGSLQFDQFKDGDPRALALNSNVGVAGRYMFTVRNGAVAPAGDVPEPATWGMMLMGFGLVGSAMRRRKPAAAIA